MVSAAGAGGRGPFAVLNGNDGAPPKGALIIATDLNTSGGHTHTSRQKRRALVVTDHGGDRAVAHRRDQRQHVLILLTLPNGRRSSSYFTGAGVVRP